MDLLLIYYFGRCISISFWEGENFRSYRDLFSKMGPPMSNADLKTLVLVILGTHSQ